MFLCLFLIGILSLTANKRPSSRLRRSYRCSHQQPATTAGATGNSLPCAAAKQWSNPNSPNCQSRQHTSCSSHLQNCRRLQEYQSAVLRQRLLLGNTKRQEETQTQRQEGKEKQEAPEKVTRITIFHWGLESRFYLIDKFCDIRVWSWSFGGGTLLSRI